MFEIPALESIARKILESKDHAVSQPIMFGMNLDSWNDNDLVKNIEYVVAEAIANDQEACEDTILVNDDNATSSLLQHDIMCIREDLSQIKVVKNSEKTGIPVYVPVGTDSRTEEPEKKDLQLTEQKEEVASQIPFR